MSEQRLADIYSRLRSISSAKTRLKKNSRLPSNVVKLSELLLEEDTLQQERRNIKEPKKTFTTLTSEEIQLLDYEETRRAIESIRSKKSNTRHMEDQSEYNSATTIETLLVAHRSTLAPARNDSVKLSTLHELLEQASTSSDPEYLTKKIQELLLRE